MSKTFAIGDHVRVTDSRPRINGRLGEIEDVYDAESPPYYGVRVEGSIWLVDADDLEHVPSTDATAKQVGAYAHLSTKLHGIDAHGAAEDVETLGSYLIKSGASEGVRDAFERLADAYLDVVERARGSDREQKERREKFVAAALTGLCARPFTASFQGFDSAAGCAACIADQTIAELDGKAPLIEQLREDLTRERRFNEKLGDYERAYEQTIPEPDSPERMRIWLEHLVAIVKTCNAEQLAHRVRLAKDELLPVFERAERKEGP